MPPSTAPWSLLSITSFVSADKVFLSALAAADPDILIRSTLDSYLINSASFHPQARAHLLLQFRTHSRTDSFTNHAKPKKGNPARYPVPITAHTSRRGLDMEPNMAGVVSDRDIFAAWVTLKDLDTDFHNAVQVVDVLDTTAIGGDKGMTDRVGAAYLISLSYKLPILEIYVQRAQDGMDTDAASVIKSSDHTQFAPDLPVRQQATDIGTASVEVLESARHLDVR
jgi:hypothetical protein